MTKGSSFLTDTCFNVAFRGRRAGVATTAVVAPAATGGGFFRGMEASPDVAGGFLRGMGAVRDAAVGR